MLKITTIEQVIETIKVSGDVSIQPLEVLKIVGKITEKFNDKIVLLEKRLVEAEAKIDADQIL